MLCTSAVLLFVLGSAHVSAQEQGSPRSLPNDAAEQRDPWTNSRGRGLAWWTASSELGVQQIWHSTLSDEGLLPGVDRNSGAGPLAGVFLGGRVSVFSLGARGRISWQPDFRYWSIDPELGLRIPLGRAEPFVFVSAGYSAFAGLQLDGPGAQDISVRGFNGRIGAGLDYYLSDDVSLGGLLSAEALALTRPAVAIAAGYAAESKDPQAVVAAARASEGSSVGVAISASMFMTLHL